MKRWLPKSVVIYKSRIFFWWFLLEVVNSYSQNKKPFFLTIVNSENKGPISYVRIHYLSKFSVITNESGKITLFFPQDVFCDTLRILSGGYEPGMYVYNGKKIKDTVFLRPAVYHLEEIEVQASALRKKKTLKNADFSCTSCGGFVSTDGKRRGSEVAGQIKLNPRKVYFLSRVSFNLIKNIREDSLFLRINIYSVLQGMPDQILFSETLVLSSSDSGCKEQSIAIPYLKIKDKEWLSVSLECLSEGAGLEKFCFSTSAKSEGWARFPGFSSWKKIRGGALTVHLDVEEETQ